VEPPHRKNDLDSTSGAICYNEKARKAKKPKESVGLKGEKLRE